MKIYRVLFALLLLLVCVPAVLAAGDTELQSGDQVVIWQPDKGCALSSARSGSYNAAVKVELVDGILTGFSDTEVWTLEQTEGGWRFCQNGQYLSMTADSNALGLEGSLDSWILEQVGELYRVKNTGRARYLYYNVNQKYWLAAASGTKIAFYVIPKAEEPTNPPETTGPTQPEPPEYGGNYLYFGQLHAHTDLSDGQGSVEEAFEYAAQVPGLDFFAVTDHSQNFDGAERASLTADATQYSQDWARGKAAAAAVTDGDFVGIFGFEMTWNQEQGHMSTFATPGFLSRDQDDYQSYASGMEHYYAALLEAENSISQFNHPGSFGDFKGFAAWSPALDQRITLIEVGEDPAQYDLALAAGWHLAPTNNPDPHGAHQGTESAARTVVLAPALTEEAIYDALANYRVYATQDGDLQIYFTLNGYEMGSEIPRKKAGDRLTLSVILRDPTDSALGRVEVVTENALVIAEATVSGAEGTVQFTLPADRGYYYLRMTQPDGDWAVTAPIWLDDQEDMGIASLKTATEVTTAGEPQRIRLELYNHEKTPLRVSTVTFLAEGTRYSGAAAPEVAAFGGESLEFTHTFQTDGICLVTASVTGTWEGEERTFTASIPITVMPPRLVDGAILDGTHGNLEPVENAMALARDQDVSLAVETEAVTAETLENSRWLIIPAPNVPFEGEFVETVADFAAGGGTVILCGASAEENPEAAARLNGLLEAMGSSLRLNADEARDDIHNGDTPSALYTTEFGESRWLEGITDGQRYGQTDGCTVTGGTALVRGTGTAYSTGGAAPVLLAAEKHAAEGWIFVSGALFLADDAIHSPGDPWALPTANQTILENILEMTHTPQEIIPIVQLRNAEPGRIYLAQGYVTAGTANPNTTFENTIYLQDDTGGIAAAPYSTHGLALGTRVEILGVLGSDGENPQLEILRMEILEKESVISPEKTDCGVSYARKGGQLLTIQGTVVSAVPTADGVGVSRFVLEDEAGRRSAVLVEDCIRSGSRGKNELSRQVAPGNLVSAVGILHNSHGEAVLRLRDCDEVHLLYSPDWEEPDTGEEEEDPDGGGEDLDPDATGPDSTAPTDGSGNPPGADGGGSGESGNPDTGDDGMGGYVLLMLLSGLTLWLLNKRRT